VWHLLEESKSSSDGSSLPGHLVHIKAITYLLSKVFLFSNIYIIYINYIIAYSIVVYSTVEALTWRCRGGRHSCRASDTAENDRSIRDLGIFILDIIIVFSPCPQMPWGRCQIPTRRRSTRSEKESQIQHIEIELKEKISY
jgi:hypothetical protein